MSDFDWTEHESDGDHCLVCNVDSYQARIWYHTPEYPRVYDCYICSPGRTLYFDAPNTIEQAKAKLEAELVTLRQSD